MKKRKNGEKLNNIDDLKILRIVCSSESSITSFEIFMALENNVKSKPEDMLSKSSLHTKLLRMKEAGYIKEDGKTEKLDFQGGRRKRLYKITEKGKAASLRKLREILHLV